ncbi:MAG: phosphate butyryltransferase [Petroclostridium sp.]|uniref:phosphate butyryltransferase n=1 Tax=Petroclostridium xylanilyticum TaxID=1792311 RepID=UPI0018E39779|nr:phosphate butyryltransferase [Petroclostridium xylanilyticum]MBZ4644755.1 phosphate butyryltransferase [Clostridia bacterium]MDK2810334.1 phosphate butyryltransferase [Petroclostridium sp.]
MVRSMKEIIDFSKNLGKKKIAVAVAQDEDVLQSIHQAYNLGLIDVSLVGDKEKIFQIADKLNIDVSRYDIVKELDKVKAARIAVDMVSSGRADVLMKGMINTADLLKVVLDKDIGLRTNRVLSHIAVIEIENYHKLLFVTDGGMNIAPDLKQKADIIQNAVNVANSLGIEKPKVAVLASVEMINPAMQCTLDAAALSKMADRGQIKNCIIDGPLAMDNAINLDAAKHKGIESEVAGDADILLVPDIEAGNILLKSLVFLGKGTPCGIIAGSKAPIVVTSRADDYKAKLYSIALASIACVNKN